MERACCKKKCGGCDEFEVPLTGCGSGGLFIWRCVYPAYGMRNWIMDSSNYLSLYFFCSKFTIGRHA